MSDPVTNVEIEDVLSSIRRLVSDGDKARTRDPAPVEEPARDAQPAAFEPESDDGENRGDVPAVSKSDKLVLTPAFLVVDGDQGNDDLPDVADDQHDDNTDGDDTKWDVEDADDAADHENVAPLELTEMVWDEVKDDAHDDADTVAQTEASTDQTPDRSELVATIAELEAAISTDSSDFEPDGSEDMGDTIQWPGSVARDFGDVPDAETADDDTPSDTDAQSSVTDFPEPETDIDAEDSDATPEEPMGVDSDTLRENTQDDDVYGDDDLDGLLEAGGVQLDEAALRDLVADVVREELTGPMGERITRNVRKLVRREIYRILSSQDFD